MTLPWLPIPRALASAEYAGWLLLTPPALRTALLLALRASDEGTVPRAGEAPERVLDAVVGAGASEHLSELVGRGVLRVERTTLVLPDLMRWRRECTPGAITARSETVTSSAPSTSDAARVEPKTTAARQLTRDRSTFKARKKQWRGVGEGETWEGWVQSPKGLAFVRGREGTHPGYGSLLSGDTSGGHLRGTPPGDTRGQLGDSRGTPGDRSLPHPPSLQREEKTAEKDGSNQNTPSPNHPNRARDGGEDEAGGQSGDRSGGQSGDTRFTASTPRLPDVEIVGLRAEEVVLLLKQRAPDALRLAYDSRQLADLQRLVTELAVRAEDPVGPRDFEALGDWLAAGGLWQSWDRSRYGSPAMRHLLAAGKLAEWLDAASQWDRAGRPGIDNGPPTVRLAESIVGLLRKVPARQFSATYDHATLASFGRVADEVARSWEGRHKQPVTQAHWRIFADWLREGNAGDATGSKGGLAWMNQRRPDLAYLTEEGALARHFDEAMEWWRARQEKKAPVATTAVGPARTDEGPALTPAEIQERSRQAAESLKAKKKVQI